MVRIDISPNHPCFAGHFPEQPVVPGVLLLQRVMFYAQEQFPEVFSGKNFSLANVKFQGAVLPGDTLQLGFEIHRTEEFKFSLHARKSSGDATLLVCSGLLRMLPLE